MGKGHPGKLSHHGAMKVLKHMAHNKGVMDADTEYMPIVDREKDAMKLIRLDDVKKMIRKVLSR